MKVAMIVVSAILWLWFLGCTISWKFGKVILVEGMGIKSAEFVVLLLYTIGFALFIFAETVGKWVLLIYLLKSTVKL